MALPHEQLAQFIENAIDNVFVGIPAWAIEPPNFGDSDSRQTIYRDTDNRDTWLPEDREAILQILEKRFEVSLNEARSAIRDGQLFRLTLLEGELDFLVEYDGQRRPVMSLAFPGWDPDA